MLTDLRRDLADALSRLSADQRIAVVLRDSFGMSYKEISRVARMPVGTAKCYVHRARAPADAARGVHAGVTVALGREQIEEILPHRDPFLFLDEVTVLEPGSRVVAASGCARTSGSRPATSRAGRSCRA